MELRDSARLHALLKEHWGYEKFYSFQEKVVSSVLNDRDSLSVISTGGGKSLCYQLPALLSEGYAVVVSPLISLMQDQVEALKEMGIRAAFINSTIPPAAREQVWQRLEEGQLDFIYLAPERLVFESCIRRLQRIKPGYFAIDEAHCISQWGHDFRAAYLQLDKIKKLFDGVAVHAFTATATSDVRKDICSRLGLEDPLICVGNVNRENLNYRVRPRNNIRTQVTQILNRHKGECGIIYCLRRKDVDNLAGYLQDKGYNALPYHAGLSDEERRYSQKCFQEEKTNIIVATIAFGMGIDRSDVRFILHTAMPKSMEHYQQQTGRAGRDGKPAECVLFYNGSDYFTWKHILKDSSVKDIMLKKLSRVYDFCSIPLCRHKYIAEYFGQVVEEENCSACDYCLGELKKVDDSLKTAQTIISCVSEVYPPFGATHIANILAGSKNKKLKRYNHDRLSAYGKLADRTSNFIRNMIDQLLHQGYLLKEGEYPVLKVTRKGDKVLNGEESPSLIIPVKKKERKTKKQNAGIPPGMDVDDKLYKILSDRRRNIAEKKGVPAYVIFHNRTLKEMAALKPATKEELLSINGVGSVKSNKYGDIFLEIIKKYRGVKNDGEKF